MSHPTLSLPDLGSSRKRPLRMKSLWGFGHDSPTQADPLVLLGSAENPWPRAAGAAPWWPEKAPSTLPKGLNHRQSSPHPQGLCPTCPTGVPGSGPAGQGPATYGKEGHKQGTRGRWRTKATWVFIPHLALGLPTSHPGGPAPGDQGTLPPLRGTTPSLGLSPWLPWVPLPLPWGCPRPTCPAHDQGPGLRQGHPAQPVARTQLERQLLSHWPDLAVGLLRGEEGL